MLNKDTLLRASQAETKASKTNSIAMAIVEADGIARAEKTRRLRAARVERDASDGRCPREKHPSKKKPKFCQGVTKSLPFKSTPAANSTSVNRLS